MEAVEIIEAMKQKAVQLGNPNYETLYIDKLLPPSAVVTIKGAKDYFYILGDPTSVRVESEYALYDSALTGTGNEAIDRMHQHQGDLTITNLSAVAHTPIKLRQQVFKRIDCEESKDNQTTNIEINQKIVIK